MADYYLGEIRAFSFNFNPHDFMYCAGQMLNINQYSTLFSVIGTMYGGDGRVTFQLPNIQSSVLVGQGQLPGGQMYTPGQKGGTPTVILDPSTIPAHTHTFNCAVADNLVDTISASSKAPATNATSVLSTQTLKTGTSSSQAQAYGHTTPANTAMGASVNFAGWCRASA